MIHLHNKQRKVAQSNARFKVTRAGRKGGKALAINTPILTSGGFKEILDIKIGDFVFDENGNQVKVEYKSPVFYNRECYSIKFSDNSEIIADANHDWMVEDKSYRKNLNRSGRVSLIKKTTKELKKNLKYLNKENQYSISTTKELKFNKQNLLIEPYFLGLWLGDGTSGNVGITNVDEEIISYLYRYADKLGLQVTKSKQKNRTTTYSITSGKVGGRNKNTLVGKLRRLNLLGNKHIPDIYKYSSPEQRLELLRGILDSDGYASSKRNEYCTIKKRLADDVCYLLNSLGIKNTHRINKSKIYGKNVGDRHRIFFVTDKKVFSLTKKLKKQGEPNTKRFSRRYITNINKIKSVPVQCLGVNSKNHLFLAGKNMIATHNTAYEVETLCFKATISAKKLNLSKTEFSTGRKVIYIAPTQDQARNIVWEALKNRLVRIGKPNEQQLKMKVPNEDGTTTTIFVGGWENRENYRGLADVIHITFDEVDTLRNFFTSWKEIFRPMFLDTMGTADFIGTPKKESANLRRLEKEANGKYDWECFHFTSRDNPYLSVEELQAVEDDYKNDKQSYQQEILAEYVDAEGSLFNYNSLLDVFTNTIDKKVNEKFLVVDIADDGTDKTIFSFWEGLEEFDRKSFARLNTENIIEKIRDYAVKEKIPYSHILVDAIGVGTGVATSSMLDGIIGFKSSFAPIKTDVDIVRSPNVSYTKISPLTSDYKNLRSQCIFTLANLINNHQIASKVGGDKKERIIEELKTYQDASKGDGKRFPTPKEKIKELIGRSPDDSDTWIMRMYFEIRNKMLPHQSVEAQRLLSIQKMNFDKNFHNSKTNQSR